MRLYAKHLNPHPGYLQFLDSNYHPVKAILWRKRQQIVSNEVAEDYEIFLQNLNIFLEESSHLSFDEYI